MAKKTTIGGQALIEGILMRGPAKTSITVRKPDGELLTKVDENPSFANRNKFFTLPIIRGMVTLVDSMKLGTSALMYSASFLEEDETEEPDFIQRIFGDKAEKATGIISLVLSFVIALVFFFIIPTVTTSLFKKVVHNTILLNLVEGAIRLVVFFTYMIVISKSEDIARVYMYHGAEHKTIHCYERGDELTVENVRKSSILHPRCGTSFLFTVMVISILVLSFFGWPNPVVRIVTRLLCLPLIAGIAYEINRLIGRSDGKFAYALSYPGLMVQKYITVKEPDDSMIEVAIEAVKHVIPENPEEDLW